VSERVAGEAVWILHRRPWQETSLHLELLTRHRGRVAVLARGARRPSRTAAVRAEPFRPLFASWSLRRAGGLATLVALEPAGPPPRLEGEALWSAFYLNEVLLRLLPRDVPQEGVHDLYAATLADLAPSSPEPWPLRASVRRFEKGLLDALGFGPDFTHVAPGGTPVDPARLYRATVGGSGTVRIEAAEEGVRGELLLALADERFERPDVLRLADRLLPACLAAHAGSLERSRRVYSAVRALVSSRLPPVSVSESRDVLAP
jgi:DNA repair protein RecO (recombination protein O)